MREFWITFGQAHVHRVGPIILDRDIVLKVTAQNEEGAQALAYYYFGSKYASVYSTCPEMKYFPRGVVSL
jgi:hypothetical protein